MPQKRTNKEADRCPFVGPFDDRYEIEAVATVDERGQMVLPKALREKTGMKAGDKLAIVALEREGKVCCLHLFRAEDRPME